MAKSKFLLNTLCSYSSSMSATENMVGIISDDRSAVIGMNDWCYIYEGSNNYRNAYLDEKQLLLAEEWARIIETRQSVCDEIGAQFLQVIVPNKLTLLPDYFPEKLKTHISYALKGILSADINANLLVPIVEFRADNVRETVFRRNDSHLTVAGNAYLTELILIRFGLKSFNSQYVETQQATHVGDLGGKFERDISEELHVPVWDKGMLDLNGVDKIKDVVSEGLNGIEQFFVNPAAPIDKKIMVIGNSFFERVPSWGLSPFFSALFSEYFFIWAPNFNAALIKDIEPDIVISQTCERFLSQPPVDLY